MLSEHLVSLDLELTACQLKLLDIKLVQGSVHLYIEGEDKVGSVHTQFHVEEVSNYRGGLCWPDLQSHTSHYHLGVGVPISLAPHPHGGGGGQLGDATTKQLSAQGGAETACHVKVHLVEEAGVREYVEE